MIDQAQQDQWLTQDVRRLILTAVIALIFFAGAWYLNERFSWLSRFISVPSPAMAPTTDEAIELAPNSAVPAAAEPAAPAAPDESTNNDQ